MHTSGELSNVLDKLANDDDFREQMLGDPVGALASIGITLDPAHVPDVRALPSKETIAADRDALHQQMVGVGNMIIFLLSGGTV